MKLTNKETGDIKNIHLEFAKNRYKPCEECVLVGQCDKWVDRFEREAINKCSGLIIKETESTETRICSFCQGGEEIAPDDTPGTMDLIKGNTLRVYGDGGSYEFEVTYCPICAQKLNKIES